MQSLARHRMVLRTAGVTVQDKHKDAETVERLVLHAMHVDSDEEAPLSQTAEHGRSESEHPSSGVSDSHESPEKPPPLPSARKPSAEELDEAQTGVERSTGPNSEDEGQHQQSVEAEVENQDESAAENQAEPAVENQDFPAVENQDVPGVENQGDCANPAEPASLDAVMSSGSSAQPASVTTPRPVC